MGPGPQQQHQHQQQWGGNPDVHSRLAQLARHEEQLMKKFSNRPQALARIQAVLDTARSKISQGLSISQENQELSILFRDGAVP